MRIQPSSRFDGANPWCIAVLIMITLVALLYPAPVMAQVDPDLLESQRRLDQVRGEREDLREEMLRIRSRVTDLSTEASNLGQQADVSASVVTELEFQLIQREDQIDTNTRDLLHTRDQLAERRAVLHRRARDIYKRGPLHTLEVLLASTSFSDLLNRYKYLYLIARHDRRLAVEVADLERQLEARERALRTDLTQLESFRVERSTEHEQLAVLRDQQRTVLTDVQSRESATVERIQLLEGDEARLASLMVEIEQRRATGTAASETPGAVRTPDALTPSTINVRSMGTIAWPVDGRVIYGFGRVTQPDGTVVRWNGAGITAPAGSAVHAVEAGIVSLAGTFEGYGPTVIVSHGAGYYTLYLYLRDLGVREGEEVRRGQAIGTVGGSDPATGPYIEFQLRVPGGQAVDPIPWLIRR